MRKETEEKTQDLQYAPHFCEEKNKTKTTQWLDSLLSLRKLSPAVCDTNTHGPACFSTAKAWSANAQISMQASISQESLSLSHTKPAKIKDPC